MWVHIGTESTWESSTVCFLRMTIDFDLKFEIHSSELSKRQVGKYVVFPD